MWNQQRTKELRRHRLQKKEKKTGRGKYEFKYLDMYQLTNNYNLSQIDSTTKNSYI